MPADIEYDEATGKATFVASRDHGWHQMGDLVAGNLTLAEGLGRAHLADLDYHMEPIAVPVGDPPRFINGGRYRASVRRNPFNRDEWQVLGAGMTADYTLHTPEEAFGFGEAIIDSGAPLAALGSINEGRRAFAAFRLDDLTIGGVDQVNNYLNVMTAFDGSMATYARVSSIRVVCSNTFSAVMGQHGAPTYRVRHVGDGLEGRVDDARAALQVGWKALEQFQAEANAFLDREVTDAEFRKITEALLPLADNAPDSTKTRVLAARSEVEKVYDSATVANVRGTAWGALNAYTEYLDWTGGNFRSDEARMVAQITPGSAIDTKRLAGAKRIAGLLKIQVPASV